MEDFTRTGRVAALGVAWPLVVCICLAGASLRAQEESDVYMRRPAGGSEADKQYQANLQAHDGNPDILVLPGLVADRVRRTVDVLAESTGLREGEAVEFLLVDQDSSHGYEALLWSFAKPSDVHRALEFIGLKPGPPRNSALAHLASGGDPVKLTVRKDGGEALPIEQLILDTETGTTLPEAGFVFSGSMRLPSQDGGPQRYAADVYDPRSVVPLFNDPGAVLDVPRQVEQGEAYGRQVVNPPYAFEKGALVTVALAPMDPEGRPLARRLRLAVELGEGMTGTVFRLTGTNGVTLAEASALTPVLERLAAFRQEDGVPVDVDLSFGEAMPIPEVVKTCVPMAMMESMGMVRVAPPAEGQLYHRAFLPDKAWRTPEGRPSQPWELHLHVRDGAVAGAMVWNEPMVAEDGSTASFKPQTRDTPTAESLREALDVDARARVEAGRPPLPPVLLVFAGPGVSYGQVVQFLIPALPTHDTVYVYAEVPPGALPAPGKGKRDASTVERRPNFLFVYTDDQRWDAMGVVQREQGERGRFPWLQTPNLDRLAAEGVRFRNAFVTLPLCSPSRAAFLTGRYNHLNGIVNNHTKFPTDSVTHATLLRAAGYRTAYIGKWHMGDQSGQRPGFDYSASFVGQGRYQDCAFEINGVETPTTGWVDDVSTDFAIAWMKQNRDESFSLVVGLKSPHSRRGGTNLPERLRGLYAGETTRPAPNASAFPIYRVPDPAGGAQSQGLADNASHLDYLRHVAGADENLGKLLDVLDELGLAENTVVVYASDNGYYLGEHGLGDKRSLYEESIRIPMLVRYPRLFGKGRVVDEMVLNIDLAPTFLDLAGVPVPREMQGVSWKALAAGEKPANWRRSFLAEYFYESITDVPTIVGVRTADAKLVTYPGHPEWTEVFDLAADPYEIKNLAADPSAWTNLSAELAAQVKTVRYPAPPGAKHGDRK